MNKEDYGRKMNELGDLADIIHRNRADDVNYGGVAYIGFIRAVEILSYLLEGGEGNLQEMIMEECIDLENENEELCKEVKRLKENEERLRQELSVFK